MPKHSCPACGHNFETAAKRKPAAEQQTVERDGKTYYLKMVNWTTGPALAWASFPDDGKPRKQPRWVKRLKEARARGEILTPEGADWLPRYLAQLNTAYSIA